jgi:predicted GTPase
MRTLEASLETLLLEAARRFRDEGLPPELAARLERLAAEVKEPCVVAVVGKVKAGKSTFLNALLGEDLATVGTTETTATINYFRYGTADAERPVCCYWRGGQPTQETRAFLDSLQGKDLETLRRADGIDHLEYRLPNTFLQRVTLVDTPGTSAVVDKHQDRTAEFLAMQGQLSKRHDQETRQLSQSADAVIYLIGEVVGREPDRAFLEEFAQLTGGKSRALNAVGVLSKIDLQPEVLRRRQELSRKLSQQLRHALNTVVPVSAGLQRALDQLVADDRAGLRHFVETIRRIPPARLAKFLDEEEFFLNQEPPDCPVSPQERQTLLGSLRWTVFTTLAQVAAEAALLLEQVEARLRELAGFEPLRQLLERHFFQRAGSAAGLPPPPPTDPDVPN